MVMGPLGFGRRITPDVRSAKALRANVQYTEFPGVKHDAWNPAYDRADMLEWMLKQRRR